MQRPTADLDVAGFAQGTHYVKAERLPTGFEGRVRVLRYSALEVHVAGRFDMICFKLYAAVDHSGYRNSKHLDDLRALTPSVDELLAASQWTRTQDGSDGFLGELEKILEMLGVLVNDAGL